MGREGERINPYLGVFGDCGPQLPSAESRDGPGADWLTIFKQRRVPLNVCELTPNDYDLIQHVFELLIIFAVPYALNKSNVSGSLFPSRTTLSSARDGNSCYISYHK